MAKRKGRPIGQTIGGIVVGFDQQVFKTTRPIPELIESAKPIPPVASSDGGTLDIDVPVPTSEETSEREADGSA
jgi:hypothetical protein